MGLIKLQIIGIAVAATILIYLYWQDYKLSWRSKRRHHRKRNLKYVKDF